MNIKKLRRELGLTQVQLAHRLQVCTQTISNWECKPATIPPAQLARIAACTSDLVLHQARLQSAYADARAILPGLIAALVACGAKKSVILNLKRAMEGLWKEKTL
jgi:DNA-binding XRE family transcriptional regulator